MESLRVENRERRHRASAIATNYWVTSRFVYDLLEFFGDDETMLRRYLDAYAPLGVIPSAAMLREAFCEK